MKERILVVEDDADILEVVTQLLELEGFEVLKAGNGQVAIDLLEKTELLPHLILLDLMMPVKDGFEFRKYQMNHPRISSIPVVVMTAEGHHSERKSLLKANAILKKPIDIDELVGFIRKQLT